MSKYLFIPAIFISAHCLLSGEPSQLASNSPFLPSGYNDQKPSIPTKPVQQVNGPLSKDFEFRGIVQLDSEYQFSLFKKSENKSYWISENETENGIRVSDFDLDNMSIKISSNGQSEQLTLMTATDNPLPVAASPAQTPNASRPGQLPPTLTNTENKPVPTRRTIPRRRVILPKK